MSSRARDNDPRQHSRQVVDGLKNAPARAMLRAVGFTDADFTRPQVGIASTWANVTPCNMPSTAAREAAPAPMGGRKSCFSTPHRSTDSWARRMRTRWCRAR